MNHIKLSLVFSKALCLHFQPLKDTLAAQSEISDRVSSADARIAPFRQTFLASIPLELAVSMTGSPRRPRREGSFSPLFNQVGGPRARSPDIVVSGRRKKKRKEKRICLCPLTHKNFPAFLFLSLRRRPWPWPPERESERASEGWNVESGKSKMEMNGSVQP